MKMTEALHLVLDEHTRSVAKHGAWDNYSIRRMLEVITNELVIEAGAAELCGDLRGPHGIIAELTQVAATCIKAIMVLSDRPEMTLAETLRAEGAHSEVGGRSLPASPSLLIDKEICSNSPKGVAA